MDIQELLKSGYAKKKYDGSVHQIVNQVGETHVRLRYHDKPTNINRLEVATKEEYESYINQSVK